MKPKYDIDETVCIKAIVKEIHIDESGISYRVKVSEPIDHPANVGHLIIKEEGLRK